MKRKQHILEYKINYYESKLTNCDIKFQYVKISLY